MGEGKGYLLSGQDSELGRLQLQSRVWEPAGRRLLARIDARDGARAIDVGCGAYGWLRILDEWVGEQGSVIGTDMDERMLATAAAAVAAESLRRVELLKDDLFSSCLPAGTFDLVHARFQIAPLGRGQQQVSAYLRLLKPGGWIVLEDPDISSWRVNPSAPAVEELIQLIGRGFRMAGGDFSAGQSLPSLLRSAGLYPLVDAAIVALEPGHPYLQLPLQFAASLRPRLEEMIGQAGLERLVARAGEELSRDGTWGTTFTLIQAYAQSGTSAR